MTPILKILLIVVAFSFAGCVTATKQPSLYNTNPTLLTKQYTPDEIAAVKQNFKANPLQYSQELGNLILWQMHQKCPEFALEFAQTPELNDGINAKEAKAMMSIYDLIKDIDIPHDLFIQKDQEEYDKIILEWHGINEKKTTWDGFFYQSPHGNIIDAKPIGFEQGEDGIDYERLKEGELKWKSISTLNDRDGILITLRYPQGNKIVFDINNQMLSFTKLDILTKDSLVFDEKDGLEGALTIKNASKTNLSPKLYALKDMVLAGENDYRYSAPLQALLWGYMDGKFKEGDNPFENYINALDFVKPIWGNMEGQRWGGFDEVTSRLNLPELLDYYEQQNFSYQYYIGPLKSPKSVFKSRMANCVDNSYFVVHCLGKAGYKAGTIRVKSGSPEGHRISYYKDKGKIFIIDNGTIVPQGIMGPFNSFYEIHWEIKEIL